MCVFLLNENNEKLFERGKMSRPFFEKLFLLLFEIKFQCVVYHSIALKKLYNFTFYCVKIGPSVRPQIHENGRSVRHLFRSIRRFCSFAAKCFVRN